MLQNFESLVLIWLGIGFITFITLLKIPAPYGKFSKTNWGPMIPSKLGWIVMEIISPLATILLFKWKYRKDTNKHYFYIIVDTSLF